MVRHMQHMTMTLQDSTAYKQNIPTAHAAVPELPAVVAEAVGVENDDVEEQVPKG